VACRDRLSPTDVARLAALRRLSMGAAHALNNLFTTVIGEIGFLHEDRKDDCVVAETCEAVLAEMDRCTKITRALLARRHPSQGGGRDVDMVRLVRELALLLGETLGRQSELAVSCPDELLPVAGEAGELELMVLTLVHYGADSAGGPSRLALRVDEAGDEVELELRVAAQDLGEEIAEAFVQPERAADDLTRTQLEALAALVEGHGARRMAEWAGPAGWVARILLPRVD
jgi:C4-dicarboxylate-specific signal transduction histidine kinase